MTSVSIFSLVLMHMWPCTSIRARFSGYFHLQIAVRCCSVFLKLDWYCLQREKLRLLIPAAGGVPNSEWVDLLSIPTHPAFFTAFATGPHWHQLPVTITLVRLFTWYLEEKGSGSNYQLPELL